MGVALWLAEYTGASLLKMEVPILDGAAKKRSDIAAGKLVCGNRRDARDWLSAFDGDSLMRRVGNSFAERYIREGAQDLLIISAGEAAAPYNLALGYIWRCRCAAVTEPGCVTTDPFDLAIMAEHEFPKRKPNILVTLGSVNAVKKENIADEAKKFLASNPPLETGTPIWTLVVGGDDANYVMTQNWVKKNIGTLLHAAASADASVYIYVSDKISPSAQKTLNLLVSHSENVCCMVCESEGGAHCFHAMLGIPDTVFLSDDIPDKITEAITAGHKAVIMRTEQRGGIKKVLQSATESLIKAGAASSSFLWGKPKYDMLFNHFLRHELAVEFRTWLKMRHDEDDVTSFEKLSAGEDFNEAKRAAEWIISNWN